MTDLEITEIIEQLRANNKTMSDNGLQDNLWGKSLECIEGLLEDKSSLITKVNELTNEVDSLKKESDSKEKSYNDCYSDYKYWKNVAKENSRLCSIYSTAAMYLAKHTLDYEYALKMAETEVDEKTCVN